jgi:hypothetical protein
MLFRYQSILYIMKIELGTRPTVGFSFDTIVMYKCGN